MDGWTAKDRTLALALAEMEDNTGPEGHPLSLEMDEDMDGWFDAVPVVNYALAARERYLDGLGGKPEPGTRLMVVDTRPTTGLDAAT